MFTRLFVCFCLLAGWGTQSAMAGDSQVYRGTWQSESSGHRGPMRARVTPRTDGNYDARFSGRFLLVIPFTYKVTLTNQGCTECGHVLSANRPLGPLLGSYQMTATMNAAALNGSFSAAGDTGQISMRRVR